MPLITDQSYMDEECRSIMYATGVIAEGFYSVTQRVSAYGLAEGERRSLGMVGQMSAELIVGAADLFRHEQWYPGACLVRQVVEIEYILFLFATDREEAKKWLSLAPKDAKAFFMPSEMRRRTGGRFDSDEYSAHCELGGHPRKKGAVLLKDWMHIRDGKADQVQVPKGLWLDLCQHSVRSWRSFLAAVREISPSNVYPEIIASIETAIAGCEPLHGMR
jgi:hypothetical protein